LAGSPQAAYAHGVGGASETVVGFVRLGFVHMLHGFDHLLFIGGVVLLAGQLKRAAALMSIFALGHSITLFTATVSGWQVNATLVDAVIALSVVFVGVVALIGRPRDWTWFAAAVGAFGLVHGLGLSTRLQALGLPEDGTIARVLAFNVGVELGQLLAVAVLYAVGLAVSRHVTWKRLPQAAYAALIAGGVGAAVVLPFTADEQPIAAQGRSDACRVYERAGDFPAGGGRPAKAFTEPGEPAETATYGDLLDGGYVVVQYRPDLPADQLSVLRDYVADPASRRVVGGANEQPEALRALTAETTLVCTAFDEHALRHFAGAWIDGPGADLAD